MENNPLKYQEDLKISEPPRSVESTANFEGNYSLLLCSRIRNPFIQEQLIEMQYEEELHHALQGDEVVVFDDNGKITELPDGKVLTKNQPYKPKSKKEIADILWSRLKAIETDTPITYDETIAPTVREGRELMPIFSDNYISRIRTATTTKNETKIKSIAEAHEKGHVVRGIEPHENFFVKRFIKGFDFTGAKVPKKDLDHNSKLEEPLPVEDMQKNFINYLCSASEIAERMSQLKGYFGFKGNEKFTKEHLTYAREHYCADTGMDNYMTEFFNAITNDTEEEFLRIINTCGI